jgi:hypothetical protein
MRNRISGVIAIALIGTLQWVPGQSQSKQEAHLSIGSIGTVPQIYVHIELQTSTEQLFVPYCGESEAGEGFLCTLGTHLEVQTGHAWHPVKLRAALGVLGGLSLDRAKGIRIAPKSGAAFIFQFSRRYFVVNPGQRLRIVVDAWADEQSMRAGRPSIQLTSPAFECPSDVTIRTLTEQRQREKVH